MKALTLVVSGFTLFLAAAATVTAGGPADRTEPGRLEGTWRVVSVEFDGRKATDIEMKLFWGGPWKFRGDQATVAGSPFLGKTSFRVDSGKVPEEMDFIIPGGERGRRSVEGIYRLDDGKLTICLRRVQAAEKGRPLHFSTEAGDGLELVVMTRLADRR